MRRNMENHIRELLSIGEGKYIFLLEHISKRVAPLLKSKNSSHLISPLAPQS